jgi:hypothetical protein
MLTHICILHAWRCCLLSAFSGGISCSSNEFMANMSVGDTLLSSSLISFSSPQPASNNPLAQQPQQQLLTATPELLCTGEVEDVRGESGQFPASLTAQQGSGKPAIYHPRGKGGPGYGGHLEVD